MVGVEVASNISTPFLEKLLNDEFVLVRLLVAVVLCLDGILQFDVDEEGGKMIGVAFSSPNE